MTAFNLYLTPVIMGIRAMVQMGLGGTLNFREQKGAYLKIPQQYSENYAKPLDVKGSFNE
jgi:hypothetical protein